MKLLVVLALVASAFAAPQGQNPKQTQILKYEVNNNGLDAYNFAYKLSDGTQHKEKGQLKNQGSENEGIAVEGHYSFMAPDGVIYGVYYTADENGFHPETEIGPGGCGK